MYYNLGIHFESSQDELKLEKEIVRINSPHPNFKTLYHNAFLSV